MQQIIWKNLYFIQQAMKQIHNPKTAADGKYEVLLRFYFYKKMKSWFNYLSREKLNKWG